MYNECERNYADCKLCPDEKNCPYELSEEINNEINEERGREVEWKNKEK